jgi:peptidoglycan/xylan/chitin deacetylase (PgdA/CDA1 family)
MTAFPWPDGHTSAAVVTVNFHGESVERREQPGQALWGRASYGRYGAQVGVQRLLDAFQRYGVRATFFVGGWDAERYPDVMDLIAAGEHEIAGHGYAHEDFSRLSVAEQTAILAHSEETFVRLIGQPPAGWRAPDGLMTRHTRRLLVARGYRYDSSFCDDDVPYVAADDRGNRLVELPLHAGAGDRMYYAARRLPATVARAWHEELSAVHEAGGLFTLTLHPRGDYGSGRAARIPPVEAILQAIRKTPGVWLVTCREVAEWTLSQAELLPVYPAHGDSDRAVMTTARADPYNPTRAY